MRWDIAGVLLMKTDNSEAANRKCTAFDYMKVKKKIYDNMYKKQSQKKTE